MPDPTLLDVIQQRFGTAIDADSDGGQILNSLTPRPPFDNQALAGQADVAPLTFTPTASGVSVRAAQGSDALVFSLPAGPVAFTLIPPGGEHAAPRVELELLGLHVPLPFLRPAQKLDDHTLQAIGGRVELDLPDLLLVVTATSATPASATLAPSHNAAGALEVRMTPPLALIGPGTVVGFGFESAVLKLDGPGEPEIGAPNVELYVAPPGIPALAMHGGGHDLRLGLGVGGGLSGDFALALANGAQAAARPRFLHNMGARLRLNRNAITLLELTGQIDVPGELDDRFGPLGDPPGQIDYVLGLALDDGWQTALRLSASGGRDYLWRTQRSNPNPDAHDLPRDTLGAYAVFTPLLMPSLPDAGNSGYVDLAIGAGAAGALAASEAISTQSITLHGGELVVRQPAGGAPEAFLLLDLETELHFKMKIGATKLLATRRPLKVRHKSIGLRLDFGPGDGVPQIKPVFDPQQGFSLDLSDPGMFEVPPPLGDIVQPEGARMARENPLTFEIDLVLKADLGVVTVDRASVRIPLDSPAPPTLTALGAHVDVPGALSGSGYLKLLPDGGFAGSLDTAVTPPVGVRVAAGLAIQNAHDAAANETLTAVLVTLGVELPVPIPLGTSGLGLFGFLGLFGMHFQRDQPPPETALQWFVDRAQGEATRLEAWKAAAHSWALGLGAVIGTVEGGFLVHAKGMVVIELPGPSLLLVMNADILSLRPGMHGSDTGKFLAVIAISPDSFTLGIVVDYSIQPLLEFRVPVEAYFDFRQPANWHLDVGGNAIPPHGMPMSVKFLYSLRADGYLMIHGDYINFRPGYRLEGFAVAAGIRAAFTWGPEPIGLYLKIAAQADVGISFKPFVIIGKMSLSGELHLFIIGVEVSAAAEVIITPETFFISAEVCAAVDFFFFEVEGCVTLELGDRPADLPHAEPLVRALSLHSRSPALLPGSAGDRPVDGSLGDAARLVNGQPDGALPVVPIDAIPVLQMEMRPCVDAACTFLGKRVDSKLPSNGWQRRGERFYRYTIKSIALSARDANGAPLDSPVDEGETPVTWWDRHGKPGGGDDNDVQLALLNWIPDPTPAAAERTISLDERVARRWGDVCAEVAGSAAVLWTFRQSPAGPSPSGWRLQGVAWPDAPGSARSAPPETRLSVSEPWRSGDPLADGLARVDAAYVSATPLLAGRLLVAPHTGRDLLPAVADDADFATLFSALRPHGLEASADAVRIQSAGLRTVRVLLFVHVAVWEHGLLTLRALDAAGNGTGFEQPIDPASSRQIHNAGDLPGEWRDPAGPWLQPVDGAVSAWFQAFVGPFNEAPLVLFEAELPAGTTQIEIGLMDDFEADTPNWGLLVVEGLTEAEFLRFSFDEENRRRSIEVVDGALHADQAKRALLRPNAVYTVDLTYDVEVTGADDGGNPKDGEAVPLTGQLQQFQFQTDDQPPDRLDPWILATSPGPAEQFVFYGDPLRVVFATNATRRLFKAYAARDLFAVVKAASGKHPPAAPGFDAAQVHLAAAVIAPEGIGAAVMTPFESALRDAVAIHDCIDLAQVAPRHERVTLTMKLEPLTNYIFDLEAQPAASPPSYPMFRRHFSTSRYESMAALAAEVVQAAVEHRRVANPGALAQLAAANPGAPVLEVRDLAFEAALREARWGDLARPARPRVTVIWQEGAGGAPPQPVALLVEATEPLWRQRDVPVEVTDKHGVRRYALQSQTWLDVVETPTGGPLAARFVHSTDGGRTLVMLRPGARGGTLSLGLRRSHHVLLEGNAVVDIAALARVGLTAAPWEGQL